MSKPISGTNRADVESGPRLFAERLGFIHTQPAQKNLLASLWNSRLGAIAVLENSWKLIRESALVRGWKCWNPFERISTVRTNVKLFHVEQLFHVKHFYRDGCGLHLFTLSAEGQPA
jgi:hypothetical protein